MAIKINVCLVILVTQLILNVEITCNKYSAEANSQFKTKFVEPSMDLRKLDKPFRMAKLNMLWAKAQVRITEPKLRSLFSELKVHDKEEISLKQLIAQGLDKDGLKEADMRKRLIGIMSTYSLLEHFEDVQKPEKYKEHEPLSGQAKKKNISLFSDKKLNALWEKAELSGFTAEELQALREEFFHHQEKIDQYHSLLKYVEAGEKNPSLNSIDNKVERFNEINGHDLEAEDESLIQKANDLREKHRDIRDGYDRLHRIAAKGPKSAEFIEPKVQGLWKLANGADFSQEELESLKIELLHYEKRLLKLRHLQVEAALTEQQKGKNKSSGDKITIGEMNDEMIKKHTRKVSKMHLDLEARIMQKHVEL